MKIRNLILIAYFLILNSVTIGCDEKEILKNPPATQNFAGKIYLTLLGQSDELKFIRSNNGTVEINEAPQLPQWDNQRGYGYDISRDGSLFVYLVDDEEPFSSDNKLLVVNQNNLEVESTFYIDRNYSWNGVPKISPDKNKIAISAGYDSDEYGGLSIYDRNGIELVFYESTDEINPYGLDWLPDGRLIFADGKTIYVTNTSLTQASVLIRANESIKSLSVRPDGQKIVYDAGGRLYTCNTDASNVMELIKFTGTYISGTYPVWSPDGNYIAFAVVSLVFGQTTDYTYSLAIVKDNGQTYNLKAEVKTTDAYLGYNGRDVFSGDGIIFPLIKNLFGNLDYIWMADLPIWR